MHRTLALCAAVLVVALVACSSGRRIEYEPGAALFRTGSEGQFLIEILRVDVKDKVNAGRVTVIANVHNKSDQELRFHRSEVKLHYRGREIIAGAWGRSERRIPPHQVHRRTWKFDTIEPPVPGEYALYISGISASEGGIEVSLGDPLHIRIQVP